MHSWYYHWLTTYPDEADSIDRHGFVPRSRRHKKPGRPRRQRRRVGKTETLGEVQPPHPRQLSASPVGRSSP
jgi:hypothetical protein